MKKFSIFDDFILKELNSTNSVTSYNVMSWIHIWLKAAIFNDSESYSEYEIWI